MVSLVSRFILVFSESSPVCEEISIDSVLIFAINQHIFYMACPEQKHYGILFVHIKFQGCVMLPLQGYFPFFPDNN